MLKANNLMLGDLVEYNGVTFIVYGIENPLPRKDEKFNDKAKILIYNNGFIDALEEELNPIKITTGILIANGYTKELVLRFVEYVSPDGRIVASKDYTNNKTWNFHIDNEDFESVGDVECDYIHEFQHMLSHFNFNNKIKA